MSTAAIPLFTPTKLGNLDLQHRIVISPPLHEPIALNIEDFYRKCATEGGLVIVPSNGPHADVSTRKNIAEVIHESNGVAFCLVDARDGPIESLVGGLIERVSEATSCGYDGVELDASQGSVLQNALLNCQSQEQAVNKLFDILKAVVTVIPEERLGIRFSPFAIVDGNRVANFLQFYTAMVECIKRSHPAFAFVHFVGGTTFEDFEYPSNESLDLFRAALAFPRPLDAKNSSNTQFISSNAYTPETASIASTRTGELISFGLMSLSNPNVVLLLREGHPLQHLPRVSQRLSDIVAAFREGKEYVFDWDSPQHKRVMNAMKDLGEYLGHFEPALSYEGTDKKVVWRKSCWFASKGIAHPLLNSEYEIAKFDGDLKDGLSGLMTLRNARVRASLEYLKHVLDSTLVSCCRALGLGAEMIQRCTVRYRIIKYVAHAGKPGGIGLHPDGNFLSALITDGPGLGVYDFDGTYREPGFGGTILMGGSTLYRWSKGTYLPTFHDVSIGKEQRKTSIVAFFNFPDMVDIPRSVAPGEEDNSFFHDIKRIKEDDKSPTGELAPLWDVIVDKHNLVLPS
ncbi:nadph dehydrogenase 2 [Moniliophthora roreri MCA 2997]|uniref:Nadph dehydrogenase 2 n=1 Tax=Moniliophthora roreri (strain MCA 2997) TaxID=1381753 RepID=V2XDY9_MONRO|nr:nadph dehydrogenase 2 [Moniliophthora roreri MCA 2997]